MRTHLIHVAVGCIALCVCGATYHSFALAAPGDTATKNAGKVYTPGELQLEKSAVFVRVDKTGLGHLHAVSGRLTSGALMLGAPSQAGELVFDLAKFHADNDAARKYIGLDGTSDPGTQKKVTENMLSAEVLDIAKHPSATFEILSALPVAAVSERGLPQYKLQGVLTLLDKKQSLEFLVDVEEKNGWQHVRGKFSILQSQFGIKPLTKVMGTIGVADKLEVFGDLWVAPGNAAGPVDDRTREQR